MKEDKANAIIAQVLREKRFENDGFCSFTNNQQTCE